MTTLEKIEQSIRDCDTMTTAVRAAPPEKFDMHHYCGSSGCVIGWTHAHLHNEGKLRPVEFDTNGDAFRTKALFLRGLDLLPALIENVWWRTDWRGYLFDITPGTRASDVDDEPFLPTKAEEQAMGYLWARGTFDREAALNRIAIVRRSLVMWRDALLAKREARAESEAVDV